MLEYVPGGDLLTVMIRSVVFPERTAQFFAGEIALALRSLHELTIVHRGLKPANILIREDGHIKLANFCLPRKRQMAANGLPRFATDYTAPELIRGAEPSPASDFWSLGVLLYEMLFGFPPFTGRSQQEVSLRILNHRHSLLFPRTGTSGAAIDLIRKLLCEPEQRLTFAEIATHPFFSGFDFQHAGLNVPPLVPVLAHPADTRHFDQIPENEENDDDALDAIYGQPPNNTSLTSLILLQDPCR
jgi:serine/threonine protein kinase